MCRRRVGPDDVAGTDCPAIAFAACRATARDLQRFAGGLAPPPQRSIMQDFKKEDVKCTCGL